MLKRALVYRSQILQEAASLAKHGPEGRMIAAAVLDWHRDNPLDGADAADMLRENFDYGEYQAKIRRRLKTKVHNAYTGTLQDIATGAYCGSDDNRKYWQSAGRGKAVRDFLGYIDRVGC